MPVPRGKRFWGRTRGGSEIGGGRGATTARGHKQGSEWYAQFGGDIADMTKKCRGYPSVGRGVLWGKREHETDKEVFRRLEEVNGDMGNRQFASIPENGGQTIRG